MNNILVIGLGSMGKRRIRLLKEINPSLEIIGLDLREDRRKETSTDFNILCEENIQDVKRKYKIEIAFICTSPLSHNKLINECLKNKWHVFTELNLVSDGYKTNIELAKYNSCCLFLSSTFLYRDEIQYISKKIKNNNKWNYVYHVGQYLPDWHPWENYKDFFVANKKTNACREILAIELPWLIKAFGEIIDFKVNSDKLTNLDIEYNDNYQILFQHKNNNKGVLIVYIVSPFPVRSLEVYNEKEYFKWNGTPDALFEYDKLKRQLQNINLLKNIVHVNGYSNFVIENAYKNEIIEFFRVINGKLTEYGFEDDLTTLNLIDKLENIK